MKRMHLEMESSANISLLNSNDVTRNPCPFSIFLLSPMKKAFLWILIAISHVDAVERATLCKSGLLDEGDLESGQRLLADGSCRQNYERTFDNAADARRFCRKRFPLGVENAKITPTHVECVWKSSSICPPDDTQIFGSCYRSVYRANFSYAAKSCSDMGYEMAHVASLEVAYWLAKLFFLETHFWIANEDVPHGALKATAKHPLRNEEMILTTEFEYMTASDSNFHFVIATRKDNLMGIPRPGMLLKAQESASFPTICAKAVQTSATSGTERILPYSGMSHNFFTQHKKTSQGGGLSWEPNVFHEHCEKITGKGSATPPKDSKSEVNYWTTAQQTRSQRSNYNDCQLQYDVQQEFLLYQYTIQGGTRVEMDKKCFAPRQPHPMCSDFERIATQGNGKGMSSIPPIVRRPLFCGDEHLDQIVRYTCDCVSEGYTAKCDPKTGKCSCASGYEPIKDNRYIPGYNCVPIPTTPDPCGNCKTYSYCSNINGVRGCQCLPGYEDAMPNGGGPKNSVCKKIPCICNNGAVCIDDVNIICGCPRGKVNVINDVNRYFTPEERKKFEKELHCAPECKCNSNAQCKGLDSKCVCKDKYIDAINLTVDEYPRRVQITGPGEVCLLKSCRDVPQNMHLVIVLDNSIDHNRWTMVVKFVHAFIEHIDSKMTTLTYANLHETEVVIKTFTRGSWTRDDGKKFIDDYSINRRRGFTGIGAALLKAYDMLMEDKSSPLKSILFIGDGEPNCHTQEQYDRFKSCQCAPAGCQAYTPSHVPCAMECVCEIAALIRQKKIGFYGVGVHFEGGDNFATVPELVNFFTRMFGKNLQLIKDHSVLGADAVKITKIISQEMCRFDS